MAISLQKLIKSGLEIDWMTIKVGFDGFKLGWDSVRLLRDEVKEYALEVLGDAAGTSDEEPVFLLADADLTDWTAIDRPLALLAERSGVTREIALRKWRYADVKNIVLDYQTPPDLKSDPCIEEDFYGLLEFTSAWNKVTSSALPTEAAESNNTLDAISAEIEILITWLAQEYEALISTV